MSKGGLLTLLSALRPVLFALCLTPQTSSPAYLRDAPPTSNGPSGPCLQQPHFQSTIFNAFRPPSRLPVKGICPKGSASFPDRHLPAIASAQARRAGMELLSIGVVGRKKAKKLFFHSSKSILQYSIAPWPRPDFKAEFHGLSS